jgi:hypothetical protein
LPALCAGVLAARKGTRSSPVPGGGQLCRSGGLHAAAAAPFKGRASPNGSIFFPGNVAHDAIPPGALRCACDDVDRDDLAVAGLAVVRAGHCVHKLSTGNLAGVAPGETGDAAIVAAAPPMRAAAAPGACVTAHVTYS